MSQHGYVEKLLEKFDMQNCKPRAAPCEQKLSYTENADVMGDVNRTVEYCKACFEIFARHQRQRTVLQERCK